MNISPMCAVELLEIIKYLDDDLKRNIPPTFEMYLDSIKDDTYTFKIDPNKNLFENDFMDETIEILKSIFPNINE